MTEEPIPQSPALVVNTDRMTTEQLDEAKAQIAADTSEAVVVRPVELEPWWMAGWSRHISPSSLGRAAACPRSEAMPHVYDNTPYAQKGTVAHKFLADCLDHGRDIALGMVEDASDIEWLSFIDVESLPAYQRDTFEAELALAYDPTTRTCRKVGQNISREEARARALDHEIVGIIDVAAQSEDEALAGDYKFGWGYVEPASRHWQLKTYLLMLCRYTGKSAGWGNIIRVRNGLPWFDKVFMDELELMVHEEALLQVLAERQRVRNLTLAGAWAQLPALVEGPHCRYCPAQWACPAKIHALRIIGSPLEDNSLATGPLTDEQAAAAWRRIRYSEKYLERCKSIVLNLARAHTFPLDGDGTVLGLKEETKMSPVPEKALKVLEAEYGQLGAAVAGEATRTESTLSWSALKGALKRLVLPTLPPKDQKISWLERDVRNLLIKSGAVSTTVTSEPREWVPEAKDAKEEAA